jgi:hypothetical protein
MIEVGLVYYHKRLRKLVKVLSRNKGDAFCVATTALQYDGNELYIGKVYGMIIKIQELYPISRLLGILHEV